MDPGEGSTSGADAPPASDEPKLAERLGINMKYVTCLSCGAGERMHKAEPSPQACKACGVVAAEAFVWSPNEGHWQKVMQKTQQRLAAAKKEENTQDPDLPTGKRDLQQILKDLTDNDRGSILSALSKGAGRAIDKYSDATVAEHQAAIRYIQTGEAPEGEQDTTPDTGSGSFVCSGGCGVSLSGDNPCPICGEQPTEGQGVECPIPEQLPDRSGLTRQIYQLGGKLGHVDLAGILQHLSEVAGKQVTRVSDLSDDEVIEAYKTMAYEVAKGVKQ